MTKWRKCWQEANKMDYQVQQILLSITGIFLNTHYPLFTFLLIQPIASHCVILLFICEWSFWWRWKWEISFEYDILLTIIKIFYLLMMMILIIVVWKILNVILVIVWSRILNNNEPFYELLLNDAVHDDYAMLNDGWNDDVDS